MVPALVHSAHRKRGNLPQLVWLSSPLADPAGGGPLDRLDGVFLDPLAAADGRLLQGVWRAIAFGGFRPDGPRPLAVTGVAFPERFKIRNPCHNGPVPSYR